MRHWSLAFVCCPNYYREVIGPKLLVGFFCVLALGLLRPDLPKNLQNFALKNPESQAWNSSDIFRTRESLWKVSLEGFRARPIFGWGFGAHQGIEEKWTVGLQALGHTSRDLVNDSLFILESTGLVGFAGFCCLVFSVPSHRPPRVSAMPRDGPYRELFNLNILGAVVSASLLVLFQFDDTALSAGNLPSALLWLFAAIAAAMRNELLLVRRRAVKVDAKAVLAP